MRHAVEVDRLSHSYERPPRVARFRRLSGSGRPKGDASGASASPAASTGPGGPAGSARLALQDVSFTVQPGEMFCLLGPNGSGKSTLFRILSTLMRQTSGSVRMFGSDLSLHLMESRREFGVVFQRPSLDQKLTARENLACQGRLYGLGGRALAGRIGETLTQMGILERADDLVEKLSGGMQRRVELAKALLHKPRLLILDEPSTGLDPGARKDFDSYLKDLCAKEQVTVLLTTHILDEAELCDRIAILDQGSLVALGTPRDLKHEIGGDIISVTAPDSEAVSRLIRDSFGGIPQVIGNTVRIERDNGHEFIPQLVRSFHGRIDAITYSKPTLEDVFIHKTGHRFWEEGEN